MIKIQASTILRIEPMRTIQNILFPVDFSPSYAAMAAFVKRAASIFGAGVALVHIFDLYGAAEPFPLGVARNFKN
jgi:hypothetical protein